MSLTLLNTLKEILSAMAFHGSIIYAGTNDGDVYSLTSAGAPTLLTNVGSRVTGLTINYPKLYISTNEGKIYDYDISASADPIIGPIIGANANVVGSGVALNRTTITAGARMYSDDGGAVLWGTGSVPDIRGQLSRLLLTKDNSGGHIRVHALMGHLKGYDAFWNTEVVSAVHGRMEIVRSAASVSLGAYGVSASVLGVIETSGAVTVSANHILAGVAAIADFKATLTQTGRVAAFVAKAYDTTNWSDGTARTKWGMGLYIPANSIGSAITSGNAAAIMVGDFASSLASGSGVTFTSVYTGIIKAYGESTVDLTSAVSTRTILGRNLVSCASLIPIAHETYGVMGQVVVKNGIMGHYHAGVIGTFESGTACNISASYGCAAVLGRVGAETAVIASGGVLAGFLALANTTSIDHSAGPYAAFAARTVSGKHAFTSLIDVPSDLAASQGATGVPGANPYAIAISIAGVTKYLLCADSWAST